MSLGKFKDAWPIWLLIIGAFSFIGYSLLQQPSSNDEVVSIQEIFPDEDLTYKAPIEEEPLQVTYAAPSAVTTPAALPSSVDAAPAKTAALPKPVSKEIAKESAQGQKVIEQVQNTILTPAAGQYTVQVYSFKDKTDAEAAATKMKTKGYDAYVLTSNLGSKGTWHRVRVGSFDSQSQAETTLSQIKNQYKSGYVVKITKD